MSGWGFVEAEPEREDFQRVLSTVKDLDVYKTRLWKPVKQRVWAANIHDACVDAGAKWDGDPFQSGPVGADSWEIK